LQQHGFKAVKHQGFVGTSYFWCGSKPWQLVNPLQLQWKTLLKLHSFKNIMLKKEWVPNGIAVFFKIVLFISIL
jgi:hypothetical protein